MTAAMSRRVATREQAHQAARDAYATAWQIIANGGECTVRVVESEEDRTLQQNAFYWGPCLSEISEQAVICGQRWTADAWHELFKRQFIGYEVKKIKVAGRKKATVIRRLKSSTDLSVRQFSNYLDKLQAFASTDLSVRFSVRDWYEHAGTSRPVARRAPAKQQEAETA